MSDLSYSGHVSFTGCTDPSLPSPCDRLSRLRVLWNDLTPPRSLEFLRFVEKSYLIEQDAKGPPKFLTFLFLRAVLSDPGKPSRISPNQRSLCLGFRFLNIVAVCSCSNEAESLQGGAYSLTAHRIPCVRFVWVVQASLRLNPGARPPFQSRNTRYRWLAKPCLVKTFTLQEMPSFAWRTKKL